MASRRASASLVALALDREAPEALQRQLYGQLRDAVLTGRLAPGTRLPASRALARELGCSRNTVVTALEQLLSEGYLEGRRGSGTYVSPVLPEHLLTAPREAAPSARAPAAAQHGLSARGERLARLVPPRRPAQRAFALDLPETGLFPFEVWGRLLRRVWRSPPDALLAHGDPAGYAPLRAAIARYLGAARALDCHAGQILITSGAQQAVDLTARLLLEPGDRVLIEDPGYPGARGPLLAAGCELVPVPVDAEGLALETGRRLAPAARLALVAPSHQYPLGRTMSLARRLALLDWAHETGGWILEDDYDSEYRYAGRPLAALQGLDARRPDRGGRVIYLGSFSKVLFPGLRLGYLVVPEALAAPFARARAALDDHPSTIVQPALAAFIEEGHFAAHLRRMRTLYAGRQAALLTAARRHLAGLLELEPDEAGLHLVARPTSALAARMSDREAARRAEAAGVTVSPLSTYFLGAPSAQGLLLGYAGVPEDEIDRVVRFLAGALRAES
jgi:GntR family transcriptional regulator/MocR family aminotransferase